MIRVQDAILHAIDGSERQGIGEGSVVAVAAVVEDAVVAAAVVVVVEIGIAGIVVVEMFVAVGDEEIVAAVVDGGREDPDAIVLGSDCGLGS